MVHSIIARPFSVWLLFLDSLVAIWLSPWPSSCAVFLYAVLICVCVPFPFDV